MSQNNRSSKFYQDSVEKKLRFGDVLKGYLLTTPMISKPLGENAKDPYDIEVCVPEFSVVLDPCCHIGEGSISLTPLIEVPPHFWDTSCLAEDMTRINRIAMPKDLMHPAAWNKISVEERRISMNATPEYGHKHYFIYEENPQFHKYPVLREIRYHEVIDPSNQLPKYEEKIEQYTITTGLYMIDFKNIYHLNCERIFPSRREADEEILKSVVLQLSVKTRSELRDKMADYFGKPPDEDLVDM